MISADAADAFAMKVMKSCAIVEGQLALPENALLAIGKEIHESAEKTQLATSLIALATRLKEVPGAGPAAEHVTALAGIALGDVELNGTLCRGLYRR